MPRSFSVATVPSVGATYKTSFVSHSTVTMEAVKKKKKKKKKKEEEEEEGGGRKRGRWRLGRRIYLLKAPSTAQGHLRAFHKYKFSYTCRIKKHLT